MGFKSLETEDIELKLCFTLPTGQSFRWHQLSELDYHGVIGPRLVHLRQDCSSTGGNVWYRVLARGKDADPRDDESAIREYLNLPRKENGRETGVSLRKLVPEWSQRCDRFRAVHPYFPGARMLRQDPVECLFQFICSSNNHISRIGGMVDRLCSTYGTPLIPTAPASTDTAATSAAEPLYAANESGTQPQQPQQEPLCAPSETGTQPQQRQQQQHQQLQLQEEEQQEQEQEQHQRGGEGRRKSSTFVTPLKRQLGDGDGVRVEVKHEGEDLLPQASEPKPPPLRPTTHTGAHVTAPDAQGSPSLSAADGKDGAAEGVKSEAGHRSSADAVDGGAAGGEEMSKRFYAFPTLEQLTHADEGALRAAGFGYRARYIVGAAAELAQKEGGGRQWLLGLRERSYEEALEALTSLPGVGPKVAACVCLFSLDKHGAVPVDTHVRQIAQRWQPSLRGKTLTNKMHGDIQDAFIKKYGEYAGWAHNTLFIAELASQQHRLPPHLRSSKVPNSKKKSSGKAAGSSNASEAGSDGEHGKPGGGEKERTEGGGADVAALGIEAEQGNEKRQRRGRGRDQGKVEEKLRNSKGAGVQAKAVLEGGSSEGVQGVQGVRRGQRAKAARTS